VWVEHTNLLILNQTALPFVHKSIYICGDGGNRNLFSWLTVKCIRPSSYIPILLIIRANRGIQTLVPWLEARNTNHCAIFANCDSTRLQSVVLILKVSSSIIELLSHFGTGSRSSTYYLEGISFVHLPLVLRQHVFVNLEGLRPPILIFVVSRSIQLSYKSIVDSVCYDQTSMPFQGIAFTRLA